MLPEQIPPDQQSVEDAAMDETVTCQPSLEQSTVIPRSQDSVLFTVLVERPGDREKHEAWDDVRVCVWHNHNGQHEWQELHLAPIETKAEGSDFFLAVQDRKSSTNLPQWFSGELTGLPKHGHAVNFTLKWRPKSNTEWKWARDHTGLGDGTLLYQSCAFIDHSKHRKYHLSHFFDDISPDIVITLEEPETPHTLLYSLTCPVLGAHGEDSGYSNNRLGTPRDCVRWLALVRLWSPWLAPRHGEGNKFSLDKDGVLLSFLRRDGMHVVCLAISGVDEILSTFISTGHNVEIKGRNDRVELGVSRVLVAVADSFEVANCAVMYHARKVVQEFSAASPSAEKIAALTDSNVRPEWLEEWYDGFTYCTWNGLGQDLTAQKIMDALDDLDKNNIKITNLIIDDNWQSLSSGDSQFKRGFSEFEANPSGFPHGMKSLTADIRREFPNVQHIAVWHALLGYWGGIDPEGKIAETYKTIEVAKDPITRAGSETFTVVAPEDAKRFYDDFYAFLVESGVDAVKTDAQFFLDMLEHAPDRKAIILEYQDAWTLAHLRHFSSRAISCMSQLPQAIFHSQLPHNKPRLLLRNSDDFFPSVEASHAWHVFCNAHNSLLTQHLNVLPDWDMFQTSHNWAAFHAAARCVSGGPIYFTDTPGKHDVKLIGQMTAQTVHDKTIILRPSRVGKSLEPYNPYEAPRLLKVGTYVGMRGTGSGIIGVFNINKSRLREFIWLEEFPGVESGDYIIGSFRLREVSSLMQKGGKNAFAGVEMGIRGWDILTAYAAPSFNMPSWPRPVKVAMMGLLGKMTGVAAIRSAEMGVQSNGRLRMYISLKALGVLGIWMSDLDARTVEDDFMVMMYDKPVPLACVRKSETIASPEGGGGVLEIDVATAWSELKNEPGWSNEVEVEIFVN